MNTDASCANLGNNARTKVALHNLRRGALRIDSLLAVMLLEFCVTDGRENHNTLREIFPIVFALKCGRCHEKDRVWVCLNARGVQCPSPLHNMVRAERVP